MTTPHLPRARYYTAFARRLWLARHCWYSNTGNARLLPAPLCHLVWTGGRTYTRSRHASRVLSTKAATTWQYRHYGAGVAAFDSPFYPLPRAAPHLATCLPHCRNATYLMGGWWCRAARFADSAYAGSACFQAFLGAHKQQGRAWRSHLTHLVQNMC